MNIRNREIYIGKFENEKVDNKTTNMGTGNKRQKDKQER